MPERFYFATGFLLCIGRLVCVYSVYDLVFIFSARSITVSEQRNCRHYNYFGWQVSSVQAVLVCELLFECGLRAQRVVLESCKLNTSQVFCDHMETALVCMNWRRPWENQSWITWNSARKFGSAVESLALYLRVSGSNLCRLTGFPFGLL